MWVLQHRGSPYHQRGSVGRGPWYVARRGSAHSYTQVLPHAERYPTWEAAEAAACGESEYPVRYEDAGRD